MNSDELAKQLAYLITTSKNTFVGNSSGGNAGSTISVRLINGTTIRAYAATNIKAGLCIVIKNDNSYIVVPNSNNSNIQQKDIRSINDYKQYRQSRKLDIVTSTNKLKGVAGYVFTKKISKTTPLICPMPDPGPGDYPDGGDGAGGADTVSGPYIWIDFTPYFSSGNILDYISEGSSFGFNITNLTLNPNVYNPADYQLIVLRNLIPFGPVYITDTDYYFSTRTNATPADVDSTPSWKVARYTVNIFRRSDNVLVKQWSGLVAESLNSTDDPNNKKVYDIDYSPIYEIIYQPFLSSNGNWILYNPKPGLPPDPGDDPPNNNPGNDDPTNPSSDTYEFYFGGFYKQPIKLFELSKAQTFSKDVEILFPNKNTQILVFRIGKAGNSGASNNEGGCRVRIIVIYKGEIRQEKNYRWNVASEQALIFLNTYNTDGIFNVYSASNTYPITTNTINTAIYNRFDNLAPYFKNTAERKFYANKMVRNLKRGSGSRLSLTLIDPKSGTTTYDDAALQCLPEAFVANALLSDSQIIKLKNEDIKVDLRYFKMNIGSGNSSCLMEVSNLKIKNFKIYGAGMSSVSNSDFEIIGINSSFF